jgi:hypothetical protein
VHHASSVGLEVRKWCVIGAVIEAGKRVEVGVPADHLVQPVATTLAPATLDVIGLLNQLLCGTWNVANEETLGAAGVPAVIRKAVLTECEPALLRVNGRRSQIWKVSVERRYAWTQEEYAPASAPLPESVLKVPRVSHITRAEAELVT